MANVYRTCLSCGQNDDHPKHIVAMGDGNDVAYHNDCHSIVTGCKGCEAVAESGLKGDELRAHIEQNDPAAPHLEPQNQVNASAELSSNSSQGV